MKVQVPEEILRGAQKIGAISALIDYGFSHDAIKHACVDSGMSPVEVSLILSKLGTQGFGSPTKGGIGKSLTQPAATKFNEPAPATRPMTDTAHAPKDPTGATPVSKAMRDPGGLNAGNTYMKNFLGLNTQNA